MTDAKSSKRKGARDLLNLHVAFVEAEWYFKAIFQSGNTSHMVGDKLLWNANGMFSVAN